MGADFTKFVQASNATPAELAQEITDYLMQGWTCPPDAQRMLARAAGLLSSGKQEEDQDGSLRSKPSAAGRLSGQPGHAHFGEPLLGTMVEALCLLAGGLTPQQAARKLRISSHGVNMRIRRAADRLGTTTAVHTVLEAHKRGLLEPLPEAIGEAAKEKP